MDKQISVERIFSLGDYQNIKFTDTITEIPEVVTKNPDALKYLRYLQLVDLEWSFLSYMKLRGSQPKLTSPETLDAAHNFIEQERTQTFEKLIEALSSKNTQEEKGE